MSLTASMWTGVSGLLAHGEKMNVVGNNIANVSTVGFKGPVDYTIANGVPVVQQGELVTADEAELTAQANGTVRRYLGRL